MSGYDRVRLYEALRDALDAGQSAAQVTVVAGQGVGKKLVLLPKETLGSVGSAALDAQAVEHLRVLLEAEKSETRPETDPETGAEVELFYEVFPAPALLLIFGAVHAAQPLSTMAKMLGFRVIVADARGKLATPERFPDADQVLQAWPDDALEQVEFPQSTYIAILTHDPKFDEPALFGSLETHAKYIGAVGSRRTNAARRERLIENGISPESLARVRGPIGLDIGANSPEEMAISILAEIIAMKHGRDGGPLTRATGNIRGEREK